MSDLDVYGPVDAELLQTWIEQHIDGAGSIEEIRQFPSRKANLTCLIRFSGGSLGEAVVRRPPPGRLPRDENDMARELRSRTYLERLPAGPEGNRLLRRRVRHRSSIPCQR